MSPPTLGRLCVVGLGPGDAHQMTPEAADALAAADELYGYKTYIDRVPLRDGQRREASDNREEIFRAQAALERVGAGARVAIVSGGDPGVFAMAAAVCEAIETGPAAWRSIDLRIIPGVTAVLAVAALAGAPLGHDFCVLSLSDNLKPWPLIEGRLAAAAEAGFVIALYNPASRARPWQLGRAFELLSRFLPATTPVIFGHAAGRADEKTTITCLAKADPLLADMATCVIIGSAATRCVPRPDLPPLVYSPRFFREASQ